MVCVDIQNNTGVGCQMQKCVRKFTAFHHNIFAGARLAVPVNQRQLAADHRGGVFARHFKYLGDHAGRGGFAVGARHTNRFCIKALHIAQHHAALYTGDAQLLSAGNFRVAGQNGRGVHQQVGTVYVAGRVGDFYVNAHRAFVIYNMALIDIAAGDRIACRRKNLYQRVHAAAPDAHKVQPFFTFQQFGVKIVHSDIPVSMRICRGGPAAFIIVCPALKRNTFAQISVFGIMSKKGGAVQWRKNASSSCWRCCAVRRRGCPLPGKSCNSTQGAPLRRCPHTKCATSCKRCCWAKTPRRCYCLPVPGPFAILGLPVCAGLCRLRACRHKCCCAGGAFCLPAGRAAHRWWRHLGFRPGLAATLRG
ncbi:hypothetical protein SDC9_121009 [bioreactor metagenome]|uniref:Uncharacterized protein n=1 Tax=bioreactor metagenome TaxID=1076179 RepID=A0A645CAS8_9ZZZZ